MTSRATLSMSLLLVALAGCGGGDAQLPADVTVAVAVEPAAPKVGPLVVTLTLTDADGKPLDGAAFRVEGNMSHAGMKPEFADAVAKGEGRYVAAFGLTMAGDWYLLSEGTLADGRRFRHKFDLKGVRGK